MEVSNAWNNLLTSENFRQKGKLIFGEEIQKELFQAITYGNLKKVESVLSNFMVDINRADQYGNTPLHKSVLFGRRDMAQLFLDRGADPNSENNILNTPLKLAVMGDHIPVIQLLLARGADPNKVGRIGNTPLHWSVHIGNIFAVKLLIDGGADADVTIASRLGVGETALHWAARYGKKDMVQFLLHKGANPNALNVYGNDAREIASINGHMEAVKILTPQS